MKLCSACHRLPYCSKACQVADWRAHKVVCGIAPAASQAAVTGLQKALGIYFDYLHLEHENAVSAALKIHTPTPLNELCALYLKVKQNSSKDPTTSFDIVDARIVPFTQIIDPSGTVKAEHFTRAGLDNYYNLNRFPSDWIRTFTLVIAEGLDGGVVASHKPVALPLLPAAEYSVRAPKLWNEVTRSDWDVQLKNLSKLPLNKDFSGPRGVWRKSMFGLGESAEWPGSDRIGFIGS
ncbi:hypothetical protein RQP46_001596 [Phenoliferia psychrophenolica]